MEKGGGEREMKGGGKREVGEGMIKSEWISS